MTAQNALKKTLDGVAAYAGYSKHSGAWYLLQTETLAVIELQKSNYGPQYYMNVALWLLPLGDPQFPREEKCHIRTRLGSLFPEEEKRLKQILDLEYPMDEATRETQFREILERLLIPALTECATLDGLKGRGGYRFLRSSWVTRAAQALLGLGGRT
ncbi:MAG TPA: DUF4304 domain-containing protein [Thermoplasmata archaeon]|nr:DUF4304 domain-containing protein [Thermoplasmata archaeon]